jgi:glycosyltransferase involved in cell wall biosynthesis
LITDLQIGGVPLHLYRLATGLRREGLAVRVIALAKPGPVGAMLAEAGIPVQGCEAASMRDIGALGRLWWSLRAEPPDILHAVLFHANMAARIIGPLAGIPVNRIICEIQTAEHERRWHLALDNLTCRLCRFEVGNSPSVVEHLHRQAHVAKSRLRCVPGAVDVEAIASARPVNRASLHVPANEPMIIWTGRLDPVKGFEEMLAAFSLVRRDRPARLVLVGDGPYRSTLEGLIRDNNLSSYVVLTGQRNDVPALLNSADLFLFCSRTEGLPNALLEAMAAALPIVATNVPGCRDLIKPGETGILVRPGSPEAIAQGIRLVLDDPARGRSCGQRAREWVRAHADARSLPQRWARTYQSLIRSRT